MLKYGSTDFDIYIYINVVLSISGVQEICGRNCFADPPAVCSQLPQSDCRFRYINIDLL